VLDSSLRRRLLGAIWLCFVARGLYYACATPLWEGFDEFEQFGRVQEAAHGRLLPPSSPGQRLSREIGESLRLVPMPRSIPLDGPHLTHDDFWKLPEKNRERTQAALRAIPPALQFQDGFAEKLHEPRQPPLYYWLAAPLSFFLDSLQLVDRVFALRIFNVLLASLAVPLAFLLARTTLGDDASALCAVAAFAAQPQVMFSISHIGPDPLALVLATAIALAAMTAPAVGRGPVLALALLLGVGLLTRTYFVALLVACAVLFIRRWKVAITLVAVCAAIAGWWYMSNWAPAYHAISLRQAIVQADWIRAADFSWNTLVWMGNQSYLRLKSWTYRIMLVVFLAALFGLARSKRRWSAPVVTLVAFHAALAGAVAYDAIDAFRSGGEPSAPGWIFCSLAAGGACLLVKGFRSLAFKAAAIPAFLFAALDLYGSHVVLTPYYAGLIAYSPTGRLAAFPLGHWSYIVFDRLAVNKPYWLGSGTLSGLWAAYVVGTFALIGIAVWVARAGRVDVWRSPE
jgi:hypothetical protein